MAVHLASYGGHLAVLEILLKYGAKVNMIDTAGYTPLHYAVQEAFLLMIVQSSVQDPDPLVRGMDPRIRIHSKMSWIRNTGSVVVTSVSGAGGVTKFTRPWSKRHEFLKFSVGEGGRESF
jgi:hypothetical protein